MKDEPYKIELIKELPGDRRYPSISRRFTDLCAGPHLMSTGKLKAVKLMQLAVPTGEVTRRIRCSREYTALRS